MVVIRKQKDLEKLSNVTNLTKLKVFFHCHFSNDLSSKEEAIEVDDVIKTDEVIAAFERVRQQNPRLQRFGISYGGQLNNEFNAFFSTLLTKKLTEEVSPYQELISLSLEDDVVKDCTLDCFNTLLKIITEKELKYFSLINTAISTEKGQAIARFLNANSALLAFGMNECPLEAENRSSIINAVKQKTSLRMLQLSDCELDDGNAKEIADLLKANTPLHFIDIGFNLITNEGAIQIAQALKANYNLCGLLWINHRLGEKALIAFAEALHANTTLEVLNLDMLRVGIYEESEDAQEDMSASCFAFAEMLRVNNTLKALSIDRSNIRDSGLMAILQALTTNGSLKYFNFNPGNFVRDSIKNSRHMLNLLLDYNYFMMGAKAEKIHHLYDKDIEHTPTGSGYFEFWQYQDFLKSDLFFADGSAREVTDLIDSLSLQLPYNAIVDSNEETYFSQERFFYELMAQIKSLVQRGTPKVSTRDIRALLSSEEIYESSIKHFHEFMIQNIYPQDFLLERVRKNREDDNGEYEYLIFICDQIVGSFNMPSPLQRTFIFEKIHLYIKIATKQLSENKNVYSLSGNEQIAEEIMPHLAEVERLLRENIISTIQDLRNAKEVLEIFEKLHLLLISLIESLLDPATLNITGTISVWDIESYRRPLHQLGRFRENVKRWQEEIFSKKCNHKRKDRSDDASDEKEAKHRRLTTLSEQESNSYSKKGKEEESDDEPTSIHEEPGRLYLNKDEDSYSLSFFSSSYSYPLSFFSNSSSSASSSSSSSSSTPPSPNLGGKR